MLAKLRLGEWVAILFVVTIFYVIVRPNSKAVDLVQAVGQFLRALVSTATDTAK